MLNTHNIPNQKPETLASEIIGELKKENASLREAVVMLALMLTKFLKEGEMEDDN